MNYLQHLDEFKQLLQTYQLSDEARQLLSRLRLVLLVGPSSSGRNTIINKLLESQKYHYIVSDTTRQPRVNNGKPEQHGREYWFRDEAELLSDLQAGAFLEAAVIHDQQVSGISIRELQTAADNNKVAINEIEVVGANVIHDAKPDALFLFIIPPSFDEWMARMNNRGELPADEVQRRVTSAVTEIETGLSQSLYHFVVNDTFARTASYIDTLATVGTAVTDDSAARQQAQQLLTDTKAFLQQHQ